MHTEPDRTDTAAPEASPAASPATPQPTAPAPAPAPGPAPAFAPAHNARAGADAPRRGVSADDTISAHRADASPALSGVSDAARIARHRVHRGSLRRARPHLGPPRARRGPQRP